MKVLLFILVVVAVAAAMFLLVNADIFSGDGGSKNSQTGSYDPCAELKNRDEIYSFSYADRIRQFMRGCF